MSENLQVLVVEDDASTAVGIVRGLRTAGFLVHFAPQGHVAAAMVQRAAPDIVVLDLNLAGSHGFDLLELWRGQRSFPVVVLSASADLATRLDAFERGAVDFVAKPFWIPELVARLRVHLGVRTEKPTQSIRWGATRLDVHGRLARVGERDVGLTEQEFGVLACLVQRRGRALTRTQIAAFALAADSPRSDRSIDTVITRIRKKLGEDGGSIRTVWGIGYCFDAPA